MSYQGVHNDELLSLLDILCDGKLAEGQFDRLQELLKDDADAQRLYCVYVDLHLGLRHIAGVESSVSRGVLPLLEMPTGKRRIGVRKAVRLVLAASLLASAAAAVVLAIVLFPPDGSRNSQMEIALKHVHGNVRIESVDGRVRTSNADEAITPGQSLNTIGAESLAVVHYADSTKLLIAGNSTVTFRKANQLIVKQGTISASVVTQPALMPLVIETPNADVEVLGTEFDLSAADKYTNLKVNHGRVKLTRPSDGKSVVVTKGKRVVASAAMDLSVLDAAPPPDTWSADLESGLTNGWREGRFISGGLPRGSKGAIKMARVTDGSVFAISSPSDWMNGLFVIHPDSHLRMVMRMDNPSWINIFFVTRTDDASDPTTILHRFNELPFHIEPGTWWEATIPLDLFRRKINKQFSDEPPKSGELVFGISWTAPAPDRGLVIDQVSVTRGGPGKLMLQPYENQK